MKMVSTLKVRIYQHPHQFRKLLDEHSPPIHLDPMIRTIDNHTIQMSIEDIK